MYRNAEYIFCREVDTWIYEYVLYSQWREKKTLSMALLIQDRQTTDVK